MVTFDEDARVPQRQSLERSFVRARWLMALVLGVLTPLGGLSIPAAASAVVALATSNAAVWRANSRIRSLQAQRRLGVIAVALDALVVLGLALAVDIDSVTAVYGALFLVVAEASARFVPAKGMAAAAGLVAALAMVMVVRDVARDDPFDLTLFAVVSVLVLLVGTVVGSAVREIYRQVTVAAAPTETEGTPSVPPDAAALLSSRERQVLALIADGYSNQRIAAALVIEPKTVKNHINNIYSKLEVSNRYEAITSVLGEHRAT
jgi:DNA-binding CsgD family transcriptional regulator